MKLTDKQKEDLTWLTKHPWFKVLELIEEEQKIKLGNKILDVDLDDDKNKDFIKKQQIYIKARRDFLSNVSKHLKETYIPTI